MLLLLNREKDPSQQDRSNRSSGLMQPTASSQRRGSFDSHSSLGSFANNSKDSYDNRSNNNTNPNAYRKNPSPMRGGGNPSTSGVRQRPSPSMNLASGPDRRSGTPTRLWR
jgi:hypothetical protein